MPAYWVARSKINDPVAYKKYTDLVPAIIAKHGGKVLARGGKFQIMEGPQKFQRFSAAGRQRARRRGALPRSRPPQWPGTGLLDHLHRDRQRSGTRVRLLRGRGS